MVDLFASLEITSKSAVDILITYATAPNLPHYTVSILAVALNRNLKKLPNLPVTNSGSTSIILLFK
jgi:hypothetical protein